MNGDADNIVMGATYCDTITGFSGVVTGISSYITGCDQVLLQPPLDDGIWVDQRWFDSHRLERVGNRVVTIEPAPGKPALKATGADIPAPVK